MSPCSDNVGSNSQKFKGYKPKIMVQRQIIFKFGSFYHVSFFLRMSEITSFPFF